MSDETRIWLVESYCPVDMYHCLMPVEYLAEDTGGVIHTYHKNRMVCRHALAGSCDQEAQCPYFKAAPETLDAGAKWYET